MHDGGGVDVGEVGGIEGTVADGDAVKCRHGRTGPDSRHWLAQRVDTGVQDVHVPQDRVRLVDGDGT